MFKGVKINIVIKYYEVHNYYYTPLNIINRTPKGHPVQCSRATLPENQLYQAPIFDGRPDSNVHRCKEVYIKRTTKTRR